MNRQNNISEELREMGSPLADLSRKMPYPVPEGYFGDLETELVKTIQNTEAAETVPDWSRSMPFSMPDGYFEGLPGQILSAIHNSNGVDVSKNVIAFTVPDGYFEQMPEKMLAAAKKAGSNSKTIPLKRVVKPWQKNWAAAAILFIIVGLGGYMYFTGQPGNPERMLANVPANEIQEYLQHNSRMELDHAVGNSETPAMAFESKEIIEYLNESGWE